MGCRNSKRIRIILIVSGILLIVAGVIAGRLIVRKIRSSVDERNCVTSKNDESYKNWAKSSAFHSSIYFWHVKNQHQFLYDGETPQLEERGPYIYKTTNEKVDIAFDEQGRVSYKTLTKQQFDAEATKARCSGCQENDNITVLNLAYFGLMHQFKGDAKFSMFMIPHIVQGYMTQLDLTTGSRNASLVYLGIVPNTSIPQLALPEFGKWLRSSSFGTLLVDHKRGGQNFSASEMAGLYNVLINASLVLPPLSFNASTANYTARGNGLLSYLGYYVQVKTNAQNQTNQVMKTTMELHAEQVRQRIDELLCPDLWPCFKVNDTITAKALMLFITTHIPKCAMAFLDSYNYGILVTRPQKELALGYIMDKLKLPPNFPNGIPVVGGLTNHANIDDARTKSKKTLMYTCSTNMELANTWAGYDNKTEVPSNYYPNAPASQYKISGGYDQQFATVPKLSPCSDKYSAPKKQYELFLAPMFHRFRITYEKEVDLYGVGMHRFLLDQQNFKRNNYSVFTDGIIDMRHVRGFPVSSSLAGFLYSDPKLYQQLGMNEPTFDKYGSFADIEPITGKPMNLKFRFQVNSVITKTVISSPRVVPLNITFFDMDDEALSKYFPVYWVEQGGTLTEADAKLIKDELMSGIRLACSVTMVLPIIGALVLFIGIILIILAFKKRSPDSNAVNNIDS